MIGAFALAAAAALSVAVPQSVLLVRLVRHSDTAGSLPYALSTAGWTGTLGVAFAWRCAVFADFAWFEQRYLGTIDRRWPVEAVLALVLCVVVFYTATLYHRTVTFGGQER